MSSQGSPVAPPDANPPPDIVEVGVVARAHGIRGELRVHLHNPQSTSLGRAEVVFVGGKRYGVVSARAVDRAYLLKLDGLSDRDLAAALRGQPVSVLRADVELDEDDVLLADLIGCQVFLPGGEPWGVVTAIEPGPQDRLVIEHGDIQRTLPVADPLFVEIDIEGRRVVVDPPEGLPEDVIVRR